MKFRVDLDLSPEKTLKLIDFAVKAGFKKENERGKWTARDMQQASRYAVKKAVQVLVSSEEK